MLKINGKNESAYIGKTVAQYIEEKQFRANTVAVELNGDILSKKLFNSTILKANDTVEIVSFVGGG